MSFWCSFYGSFYFFLVSSSLCVSFDCFHVWFSLIFVIFLCSFRMNFMFLDGFCANFLKFLFGSLVFCVLLNVSYASYVFLIVIFHCFYSFPVSFLCSIRVNFLFSAGFHAYLMWFSFGSLVFCDFQSFICFIANFQSNLFVCMIILILHFGVHCNCFVVFIVISMVSLPFDMFHFYPLRWSQKSIDSTFICLSFSFSIFHFTHLSSFITFHSFPVIFLCPFRMNFLFSSGFHAYFL